MARGPLPNATRIRTAAPTIPTTELPAGGRKGRIPAAPTWIKLGPAGGAWWAWAWRTPHSAAWSTGDLVAIAHRAAVEDVLAELERIEDAGEEGGDPWAAVAAGKAKLSAIREASTLDDKLGLSPKAMAQLRWKIVDVAPVEVAQVADLDDRRKRLTG